MSEDSLDQKRLDLAITQLEKQYGTGSVMRMNGQDLKPWPSIPTGALTLDLALGIGGLPRGRIVEIFGPESAGKTTLTLSIIAQAQALGEKCLFIDAEHALDPIYAQAIGVNVDELMIAQPDYGEQAIDILRKVMQTGAVSVIVVDSVANLTPKAEIDGEPEAKFMGSLPRLMSESIRKITAEAGNTKTLIIFINQIREKLGVMFGNPEVTPGGRALKFQSSVRIEVRRKEDLKNPDGSLAGITTKATIKKNKMGPPFRIAEFDIMYGRGISEMGCLVDLGEQTGVFAKSGAWYSYNGDNLGQGRTKTIEFLASDLDFAEKVKSEILEIING